MQLIGWFDTNAHMYSEASLPPFAHLQQCLAEDE